MWPWARGSSLSFFNQLGAEPLGSRLLEPLQTALSRCRFLLVEVKHSRVHGYIYDKTRVLSRFRHMNPGWIPIVYCGGQGVVTLVKNPVHHSASMHIKAMYNFVRDYVTKKRPLLFYRRQCLGCYDEKFYYRSIPHNTDVDGPRDYSKVAEIGLTMYQPMNPYQLLLHVILCIQLLRRSIEYDL